MKPLSLRWRLVLIGGAAIGLVMALSVTMLAVLFDRHVQRVGVEDLRDRALTLLSGIEPGAQPGQPPRLRDQPRNPAWQRPFSGHYWQVWLGDQVLRSRSLWDEVLPVDPTPPPPGAGRVLTLPGPAGQTLLVLDQQVLIGRGDLAVPVRLLVAEDQDDAAAARAAFLRDLMPWLGGLMVALMLGSFLQVTLGLRPLAQVGAHLDGLAQGRRARLGQDLPAEVAPLADRLDRLLDDRDRELDRARHRAGDLAHGFKTPLQALMGDAQNLRDLGQPQIAASIEQVATVMRRHVDRELARARIRTDAAHARAEIAPAVERVIGVLSRTPAGAGMGWRIDVPPGPSARIDPDDLTEALGALLENALRHARSQVGVALRVQGAHLDLAIRDDGPGVPPAALERLVQRGVRLDESGDGQGIGLAIATEIAEAAGGGLTLANADPGLLVRLRLPLHLSSGVPA
ncbi:HAMP domain-containing sensor histidine kinase [Paracoccus nototheniae]|uniref:histidine kinase n=1 Tax=Paracoccus nototheniae TaxID=2489002 RepID=A0ABW4E015_9RHOB|nr:HAMP domain-containing sensor histidine kinase [Paracoccus nototheniae]